MCVKYTDTCYANKHINNVEFFFIIKSPAINIKMIRFAELVKFYYQEIHIANYKIKTESLYIEVLYTEKIERTRFSQQNSHYIDMTFFLPNLL